MQTAGRHGPASPGRRFSTRSIERIISKRLSFEQKEGGLSVKITLLASAAGLFLNLGFRSDSITGCGSPTEAN